MPTLHPEWGLWDLAYGHKPGTYPGQKFAGRGALQALGVHTNYYGGIQSRCWGAAHAGWMWGCQRAPAGQGVPSNPA